MRDADIPRGRLTSTETMDQLAETAIIAHREEGGTALQGDRVTSTGKTVGRQVG